MAWTDPRTWVTDELVTAAQFNTHIRDNLNTIDSHLIVRKTADESTTSSTLQNDDVLLTPSIGANEVWSLEWKLWIVTTASFKVAVTFPSGTFSGAMDGDGDSIRAVGGTSSPTNSLSVVANVAAYGMPYSLKALFTNGATPGAVTLQWAITSAGTVTVKANSTLWGVKLA